MLAGHSRYDYHAIHDRTDYAWPDGKRLAVYVAVNIEHFAFGTGLGAELAPGGGPPDILNFAWRDYGNRVGVWRLLDLLDEIGQPSAALINTSIYDYAPEIVTAFRNRGDEIVGHGHTNSERQGDLDAAAEVALIKRCTDMMTTHEGYAPLGWLGPWISESQATPDLLHEAGYRYLLDWCHDDQPIWMRTRNGQILSVPYPQELNDIPMIVARKMGAVEFADMIIDNFDEMLAQCTRQPLAMGLALHPYIVGQPYRLRQLRRALTHIVNTAKDKVWLTTPGRICEYVEALPAGTVPGDNRGD